MSKYYKEERKVQEKVFKTEADEYFYSLVRKKVRAKRACLKCQEVFVSASPSNRLCANCQVINSKLSPKHEDIFVIEQPGRSACYQTY